MNWKSSSTTDNAKNTIWSERCSKEMKSFKPFDVWSVNPKYIQRTVISDHVNKRGNKFLTNRLQSALDFSSTSENGDDDHYRSEHGGGGARSSLSTNRNSPTPGLTERQKVLLSSASPELVEATNKTMTEVASWLRKNRQRPEEKYSQPMTTAQEYGWNCVPDKGDAPAVVLPHHRHLYHPRSTCDVTRIAHQMLASSGGAKPLR
eukprot:PhM_4_TR12598/c0_g1_i1/m.28446